ncbi:MAG: thioredoxin family protein [Acidobacteriota bacterium]|nr:MAG: thioredoxin family protein [Acidobacteriota bacterium]
MNKGNAEAGPAIGMGAYLERSMSFGEYSDLIDRLVEDGKTSGPIQTEKLAAYTLLNRQRMRRLSKTIVVPDSVKDAAQMADRKRIWLVITEAWCGDAAQAIPAIEAVARLAPNVTTRYILRDEDTGLIDRFLTNGGRSIPKVICLDAETLGILGTWGPRPSAAQEYFAEMKAEGIEKPKAMEQLQRWYNSDRASSILSEFETFLLNCGNEAPERAAV